METQQQAIKAIIGLGNPGKQYASTRHNIGFRVVDLLCEQHNGSWQSTSIANEARITIGTMPILLIKPQTFMNSSGDVIPGLKKRGIGPENILVVHDELELPFGAVKYRFDGSAKGHNGLRSIIQACGPAFGRIRCGIGRPENKDEVPEFVLKPFNENHNAVERMVEDSASLIGQFFSM